MKSSMIIIQVVLASSHNKNIIVLLFCFPSWRKGIGYCRSSSNIALTMKNLASSYFLMFLLKDMGEMLAVVSIPKSMCKLWASISPEELHVVGPTKDRS